MVEIYNVCRFVFSSDKLQVLVPPLFQDLSATSALDKFDAIARNWFALKYNIACNLPVACVQVFHRILENTGRLETACIE